jgi:hypothetical protein
MVASEELAALTATAERVAEAAVSNHFHEAILDDVSLILARSRGCFRARGLRASAPTTFDVVAGCGETRSLIVSIEEEE